MEVKMCPVGSLTFLVMILACLHTSLGLYDQYQQGVVFRRRSGDEDTQGYTLYLKPVLVPLDRMYLGQELVLFPGGLHYLPYPLTYQNQQHQRNEPVHHHVERNSEYDEEEDRYSEGVGLPPPKPNRPTNTSRPHDRPPHDSGKTRSVRTPRSNS